MLKKKILLRQCLSMLVQSTKFTPVQIFIEVVALNISKDIQNASSQIQIKCLYIENHSNNICYHEIDMMDNINVVSLAFISDCSRS